MRIPKFNFKALINVGAFVIGIAIVVVLTHLDATIGDASDAVVENRLVDCRVLLALQQEVVVGGPCDDQDVRGALNQANILNVGTVRDHRRTQFLLCAAITEPSPRVLQECEEVLDG